MKDNFVKVVIFLQVVAEDIDQNPNLGQSHILKFLMSEKVKERGNDLHQAIASHLKSHLIRQETGIGPSMDPWCTP